MEITKVRVKLAGENRDRLRAFCSIEFDREFVLRDVRIIDGDKGPFVAMPSRKLTTKCHRCRSKNELCARYCNSCGERTPDSDCHAENRPRLFADIAHPINSNCRNKIQNAVLAALEHERILAQEPDYVCTFDDFGAGAT